MSCGKLFWRDQFGEVRIVRAFRCHCGQISAMAVQTDDNAAMVHTSPRCEDFEALDGISDGLLYFAFLQELELTPELISEIARRTSAA